MFKSLTPEESKARLSKILEKVDINKDGLVSVEELRVWIKDTGRALRIYVVSNKVVMQGKLIAVAYTLRTY